jgi:CheY-like chemotaxis protein
LCQLCQRLGLTTVSEASTVQHAAATINKARAALSEICGTASQPVDLVIVQHRMATDLCGAIQTAPPPMVLLSNLHGQQQARDQSGPGRPFAAAITTPVRLTALATALRCAAEVGAPPTDLPLPVREPIPGQAEASPPAPGEGLREAPLLLGLPTPSRLRVLVADDSDVSRKVLSLMLRRLDTDITLVASGEEALTAVTSPSALFDVVIVDRHMPNMDGEALARAIRAVPDIRQPAIVGISGDDTWSDMQPNEPSESAHTVLDAFLVKPVLLPALQAALHHCRPDAIPEPASRHGSLSSLLEHS